MKKFIIDNIVDIDNNQFDRQQRIDWWSQEKLEKAKVMVVGAGATGNETLKNLALLGIGNIFIVDFDTISTSNLSRAVLFRQGDEGKKKTEIAAIRTKELCLAPNAKIVSFHGDIVWELGTGIYDEMDIVLGCLDNIETRIAINRNCWLTNTPWIDAGIYELAARVSVFIPPQLPCYECSLSPDQVRAARVRYSCDDFKKSMFKEGKMPTVQISSAIASAIQVQEAVKLICGQEITAQKMIFFQGKINDFDIIDLPINPDCYAHATYPEVISIPFSTSATLKEFLTFISEKKYSGSEAKLDFSADRTFIKSVACRSCGKHIEIYRPSFNIYDYETICNSCKEKGINLKQVESEIQTDKVTISQFSLRETESRILKMSLNEIGVPYLHIVAVIDKDGNYKYYKLMGDNNFLLPS